MGWHRLHVPCAMGQGARSPLSPRRPQGCGDVWEGDTREGVVFRTGTWGQGDMQGRGDIKGRGDTEGQGDIKGQGDMQGHSLARRCQQEAGWWPRSGLSPRQWGRGLPGVISPSGAGDSTAAPHEGILLDVPPRPLLVLPETVPLCHKRVPNVSRPPWDTAAPPGVFPALRNLAGFGYHSQPQDTSVVPRTPRSRLGRHGHPRDTTATSAPLGHIRATPDTVLTPACPRSAQSWPGL